MNRDIGEELLALSLGINRTRSSNTITKKRKGRDTPTACEIPMQQSITHRKLQRLVELRDQMLIKDSKRIIDEEESKGLQLIHLLLVATTAIDSNDLNSALDTLQELYKNAFLYGDPIQRSVAYFTDALAARFLSPRSPLYRSLMAIPTPEEEFSAFTCFYQASPYYQFAHFTANQAIVETFEGEWEINGGRIHVVDFDVSYGFQWPSLMQSLSDIATRSKPISLHITGYGGSMEELKETESRLTHFASSCPNLFFEFEGTSRGSETGDINIKENATVVVNSVFYLQTLRSSREIDETLAFISSLNPSLVFLVDKENYPKSSQNFLSRFMDALYYFAAMFDSLNELLPADSSERLNIEKNYFGREIKREIISECKEESDAKSLKERMEGFGFEEMELSSRSLSQAKLLLKMKSQCTTIDQSVNGGFQVIERDERRGIPLGWRDKLLITASGWRYVICQ